MHLGRFSVAGVKVASEASGSTPEQDADANVPPMVLFESLCKALQENYPTLEFAGWRGDEWIPEFRTRIRAAPIREAAFELMNEFVCRLNDYPKCLARSSTMNMSSYGLC